MTFDLMPRLARLTKVHGLILDGNDLAVQCATSTVDRADLKIPILQALKLWETEKNRIDLLLTDLMMPEGMTGLELGRKLTSEKPSLKTVYASGYSSDVMGRQGVRQQIVFLQKPYPAQTLVKMVREVLDAAA